MTRVVYSISLYLTLPFFMARLLWRGIRNRGYWRRIGERFGFAPAAPADRKRGSSEIDPKPIWIHAVSLGEVQAAVPIIEALRERHPRISMIVTTTTPTGMEHIVRIFGAGVVHRYLPFDLPGAVARFLRDIRPQAGVIMETEIWPNLLAACRAQRIPVMLANARLSGRSAKGYRRLPRLFIPAMRGFSCILAQSEDDARRLISIGASASDVEVGGNTKFDIRLPDDLGERASRLRAKWGAGRGVLVAASTHEGEEERVLEAFEAVLARYPKTLLVLVPRHPERFDKVAAVVKGHGFSLSRRSHPHEEGGESQVFLADSMGELPLFLAAGDIAFIGGSLVEIGGHNSLEAAAVGRPVLFGPHLFNFAGISRDLIAAGAAKRVCDAPALGREVVSWLDDPQGRRDAGERGRAFVAANRGARDRIVAAIERLADLDRK
ncbi:lipid IV(A) 3-deoxy-D-manno-octulosonic acid transferase [Thioalkalivibrio sp. HK1]|uniref:lipid IV(A) 3-deoxy-D-manno-octulosonic acid transferase n=1 Tax=Thioalkalivibrio sp. HK1 TaxID=1469245 RepID=UPI000470D026|nr:lipid IV(A) 3-deoxy-D-manno-octulosonic acid transferase [Thioalkalivibrio sp. HK1]